MKKIYTVVLLLSCLLLVSSISFGQTTVSYTGMGAVTCPAAPVATISPTVTGLTFSQLSRGSGVTCTSVGTGIAGSGFNGTLAANLTSNAWYTFSITSDASTPFTLNSLSIVSQVSSATGSPNVSIQYSIGASAKTVIGSFTPTTTSTAYPFTGLSIAVGVSQTLNIFIIPNNLTAAGTTCRVNNATSATVTTGAGCTMPSTQASSLTTNTPTTDGFSASWTAGNGNGTMVVVRPTAQANTLPASGTAYSPNLAWAAAAQIDANNRVIFRTAGTTAGPVTGLTAETQYTVTAYEYNTTGNCYNTTSPPSVTRYTLSTEPTGHSGSFTNTVVAYNQIDLGFSASAGIGADGYVILRRADGTNPTTSGVTDGVTPASWTLPGGTTLVTTTTSGITYTNTGLTGSTNYCYLLIPYNWNGTNAETYNYRTAATVPITCGTTPAAPSLTSDIILSGMTYTSNIDYTAYQVTAPLTNTTGNIDVMGITIRDGGTSTPDADALPTILTGITFSGITGTSMIRTAALFDGNTMVANVPTINVGANTIAFSGLSYSCADNTTRDLTLRVSFLTTVTDNLQMVFSVTNANVTTASGATSSQMAAFTTLTSSTTGDRNRIEVTATKLAFVQQPSNTSVNNTMSPSPSVRAVDANNNLDLDYSSNISISSSGTMTGNPLVVAATTGLATYPSVIHTVTGTGYTLTATSVGLTGISSSTFDITSIVYVNGDYRTTGSGTWVSNNASPAIWQRFNGSVWATSNSPSYNTSNNVYIQNGHTLTTGGSFGNSVNLKILQGGIFNCNHSSTTGSIYIYGGGILNINAALTNSGNFDVEDNADVVINHRYGNGSATIPALWNGVENFRPNSNLTFTSYDCANDFLIPDNTSISTNTYSGYTAAFGNIILDFGDPSSLGSSDDWIMLASGVTINMAHGDLIFRTNNVVGADMRISTTGTVTSGIGGDFIVEDTYIVTASSNFIMFKTSGTLNFTIKGNMSLDQATTRIGAGTNPNTTVNIEGDLEVLSGAFLDMQSTISGTNFQTINLKGDLYATVGGRLSCTNTTVANNIFNFNGTGDGLTNATTQTIDVASTSSAAQDNISFFVKPGAYVKLINRDFQIGNSGSVTVQGALGNEGKFDFGYNGTSGWLVKERTSSAPTGTTVFDLDPNGVLKITHQNGIVTAPTLDGNVQLDTRTFDLAATYHYIGKQNQFTGNALPSTSSAKVVICELETDNMTLTMSGNTAFSSTTTVDATYGGHLYIKKGQFIETTTAYVTSDNGTLRMEPNTLYYIPKGNNTASASNSDLIPRMTGALTNAYFLNGGTIEFAGTGAANAFQTLRGSRTYKKLKFSGANTYTTDYKFLSSNATVDSSVEITNGAIVDCIDNSSSPASFTGNGGLIMSGSLSRLRIKALNTVEPELTGINVNYSLTGGTVEFYGTSNTQQQLIRGNYGSSPTKISYYNIEVNAVGLNAYPSNNILPSGVAAAGNVDAYERFGVQNKIEVFSPAVLRLDETDYVDGIGNFIVNSGAGLLYGSTNGIKTSGTGASDGNIRVSGTRTLSTSAIYGFVSSGNMVTGNGLPTTVSGLFVLKNSFADIITITNSSCTATNILYLHSGKISSANTNKLILDNNCVISNPLFSNAGSRTDMGHPGSYVIGQMGRISTSTSEKMFPIGSSTVYGPISITPQNPTAQTYTCDYTSTGYGIYALDPTNSPQLNHISLVEYWTVTSNLSGTTNDDAKVKLFWRTHSQVGSSATEWAQLKVAHFDGVDWNKEGNSPAITSLSTAWGSVESDVYVPDFSPVTLATEISGNPLPVELTSFTATCMDNGISKINWSTASELNSKQFILQRSIDAVHYTTVAIMPAAGFSSQPINYTFIDSFAMANSSYYRLIEVDNDDKQTNYSFIAVECKEIDGTSIFYNKPKVMVEINSNTNKQISLNLFEVSGKLLHQESRQIQSGYNKFSVEMENDLANGIYIIQMTDGSKISTSKLWVH